MKISGKWTRKPICKPFFRPKIKSNLTDIEIARLYRESGKNIYIEKLFDRYAHLVYGTCLKYLENKTESKDSVIEIFEIIMIDLRKTEIRNFSSWLYSVCRNHCMMKIRVWTKQCIYQNSFIETEQESTTEIVDHEPLDMDSTEHLDNAIDQLNESQRVCITLFYYNEKSYQEIHDQTEFTVKQVKSHIQNGKRNLKNILIGQNETIRETYT